MAQLVISIAAVIAFLCTFVYLHAMFRLHGVIAAEKPEWVNVRGALDFFYTGFPRVANPNVGAEVVKIALGSRARQLNAPVAARFVRRIRVCLPLGLLSYLVLVLVGSTGGA
ncbi:hypothetical protein [Luteimonas sp. MC1895]|uniref:hypothetical protein n=1 Tax=Luteimonas sp. MC1895 TaxID=2819513 RepID=UPI0018F099AA|nr:hypothetical protein [Luteimonas sp. MC1895]MBJ6979252.1 hypothetical protein [Luteimonas sp. MC1895]